MCDSTIQSWAPPIQLPFGQTLTPAVHNPLAGLQHALTGTGDSTASSRTGGIPASGDPSRGSRIDLSA